MDTKKQFKNALSFVQKKHAGQTRDNSLPAWHHLLRVSRVLNLVLNITKEGSIQKKFIITLAALGHDLLEDTDAKEPEIKAVFGDGGLRLIQGMTNWWGDNEKKKYIKQVLHSEESVRLIKLADLYDNISSVCYNIKALGKKWTISYFLPIVTPMRKAVAKTKFKQFSQSAKLLINMILIASLLLEEELKLLRGPKG